MSPNPTWRVTRIVDGVWFRIERRGRDIFAQWWDSRGDGTNKSRSLLLAEWMSVDEVIAHVLARLRTAQVE